MIHIAEYVTSATQTVAAGQNVLFTETPVCGNCSIIHRNGSGVVSLRGSDNRCNTARYKVRFIGNIAVATGGTVGPISVAIALAGEPLYSATATVVPAAIGNFFNVSAQSVISVPFDCCQTVAVENVSDPATPIDVANASLVVERIC